jgi:hypothetical protein
VPNRLPLAIPAKPKKSLRICCHNINKVVKEKCNRPRLPEKKHRRKRIRNDNAAAFGLLASRLRAVFIGKLTYEIHLVVKYATDFDLTVLGDSEQQKVTRPMDAITGGFHAGSTVPKMIGASRRCNLRPALDSGTVWGFDYVLDRLNQ